MDWLGGFLTSITETARTHGVDPLVFTALFIGSIPFFWFGIGLMGRSALRRPRPLTASRGGDFRLGLIIYLIAWATPYFYVMACGHSLPWWFWLMFAVTLTISGHSAWRRIRDARRVQKGAGDV